MSSSLEPYRLNGTPIRVNRTLIPESVSSSVTVENFLPSINETYTHCLPLGPHDGPCTAVAIDNDATCVLTGGLDGAIKMYDLNQLTDRVKASYHIYASPGFQGGPMAQILDLVWRPNGEHFLAATSAMCTRIYDARGQSICQTSFGVQTVRDIHRNTGHTDQVTSARWSPSASNRFVSASLDGSARVYDLHVGASQQVGAWKHGDANPLSGRIPIHCVSYSSDGNTILTGGDNGIVQAFDTRIAHSKKSVFSCDTKSSVAGMAVEGITIATRNRNHTLNVYDVRSGFAANSVATPVIAHDQMTTWKQGPCDVIITGDADSKSSLVTVTGEVADRGLGAGGSVVFANREIKLCFLQISPVHALRRISALPREKSVMAVSSESGHAYVLFGSSFPVARDIARGLEKESVMRSSGSGIVVSIDDPSALWKQKKLAAENQEQPPSASHGSGMVTDIHRHLEDLRKRAREDE
eukprot:PhF_6_TR38158/c0_g1_i1/m.57007